MARLGDTLVILGAAQKLARTNDVTFYCRRPYKELLDLSGVNVIDLPGRVYQKGEALVRAREENEVVIDAQVNNNGRGDKTWLHTTLKFARLERYFQKPDLGIKWVPKSDYYGLALVPICTPSPVNWKEIDRLRQLKPGRWLDFGDPGHRVPLQNLEIGYEDDLVVMTKKLSQVSSLVCCSTGVSWLAWAIGIPTILIFPLRFRQWVSAKTQGVESPIFRDMLSEGMIAEALIRILQGFPNENSNY